MKKSVTQAPSVRDILYEVSPQGGDQIVLSNDPH